MSRSRGGASVSRSRGGASVSLSGGGAFVSRSRDGAYLAGVRGQSVEQQQNHARRRRCDQSAICLSSASRSLLFSLQQHGRTLFRTILLFGRLT